MGYNKDKIYEKAQKVITENGLFFVEDVVSMLPISKTTFYDYYPVDSNELDTIKDLLDSNKIAMKVKLRQKLANGEKAAEILALYKLIATDDERRALSMQHIDHTSKGKTLNVVSLGTGIKPDETTT